MFLQSTRRSRPTPITATAAAGSAGRKRAGASAGSSSWSRNQLWLRQARRPLSAITLGSADPSRSIGLLVACAGRQRTASTCRPAATCRLSPSPRLWTCAACSQEINRPPRSYQISLLIARFASMHGLYRALRGAPRLPPRPTNPRSGGTDRRLRKSIKCCLRPSWSVLSLPHQPLLSAPSGLSKAISTAFSPNHNQKSSGPLPSSNNFLQSP